MLDPFASKENEWNRGLAVNLCISHIIILMEENLTYQNNIIIIIEETLCWSPSALKKRERDRELVGNFGPIRVNLMCIILTFYNGGERLYIYTHIYLRKKFSVL